MQTSVVNKYHLNEEQLLICWQQFLDGEREAFGRLISFYYAALFQYGMKMHADKAFVQDCIQDMATHLWSRRERLSREVHVKSYLFKSLRHDMMRQLRRRQLQAQHIIQWWKTDPHFDAEFSVETSIIDNEAAKEQRQRLHESLQSLSPRQQEIIYLRYYQNMDHEQVAVIMKLQKEAVYNLLSAAIKRLKSHWGLAVALIISLLSKFF
ncbi:sigma-70 family RNA polymerase sigma factor [Chitinophaga sp. Mgbs1]|uniref:Sigma-70 family RNA polymerase sigma factor n=1 Tax=Chitinophaga solisilvae TaxID=1233460 RepID=A0A3S1DTF1_9BACT|nr:sigma-70 family RNA polymerase sigma factor [Chitinophaga solisilvae]